MEETAPRFDPPLPRGRILIVDDDRAVAAAIGRVLRPLEPTFVQSAVGGVARIEAGARFEAVLCDIQMPGMTGMEFYDAVAKIAPDVARRIVFVTGSVMTPELLAFFERAQCACIPKPFRSSELRAAVAAAADLAVVGRPVSTTAAGRTPLGS
jgi:CheY-like chemotaxis protein